MFEVKYIHNNIKLHEIIYERNYIGTNQLAPRFRIHIVFFFIKKKKKKFKDYKKLRLQNRGSVTSNPIV